METREGKDEKEGEKEMEKNWGKIEKTEKSMEKGDWDKHREGRKLLRSKGKTG